MTDFKKIASAMVGVPEVRVQDGACQAKLPIGSDEEILAARELLKKENPGLDLQWVAKELYRQESDGWTTIGMVWEEAATESDPDFDADDWDTY